MQEREKCFHVVDVIPDSTCAIFEVAVNNCQIKNPYPPTGVSEDDCERTSGMVAKNLVPLKLVEIFIVVSPRFHLV